MYPTIDQTTIDRAVSLAHDLDYLLENLEFIDRADMEAQLCALVDAARAVAEGIGGELYEDE